MMPRLGKVSKKAKRDDDVPEVYRDMLAEARALSPALTDENDRSVKRRRIGGRIVSKGDHGVPNNTTEQSNYNVDTIDEWKELFEEPFPARPSVVKSDSEDSALSDFDWEEVDLQPNNKETNRPNPADSEAEELNLTLNAGDNTKARALGNVKRKPINSVEKELRLCIHKMHLCCLFVHVFLRNHWCNDEKIHTILRRILPKKSISYLNPREDLSQFQRSRSFMDGLEQASGAFRSKFKITARGMSRPAWAENAESLARSQPPTDIDLPMEKQDFEDAAQQLKASRDVGAQLFCALLRSVGVETRLVCSLQTLPFNSSSPTAPMRHPKYDVYISTEQWERNSTPQTGSDSDHDDKGILAENPVIGAVDDRARLETATTGISRSSPAILPGKSRKPIRESKYPVYWIEAFNEASQKWVPVDSLVTKTIAKPSKLEPPIGDPENKLVYAIAFEDDGSAHDVTRRYAKAFNAKTRRDRVESTKAGHRWWRKVMKRYQRLQQSDRDQLDEAELVRKEASEPMPKNVQDFKNHPYYALERHLRRHEVIHPKREVGKINAGKSGGSALLESVFRRQDVQHVQSGDKWYRSMGREIKPGEQPLKRVAARRPRVGSIDSEGEEEDNVSTALYAMHQTKQYVAPSVVNGRVPKNVYGNLDIYVSTMIPPGGTHIKHSDTVRAAKTLGIDFAEAVTGFNFRGRHGTAVIQGAVVASEYREAVEEVLSAIDHERIQAVETQKSLDALRMWKRLLTGLRIRERIEGYDIEGERDAVEQADDQMEEDEEVQSDQGGGFFPDQEVGEDTRPIEWNDFRQLSSMDVDKGKDADYTFDNPVIQHKEKRGFARDHFLDNLDDDSGGGFVVEDDHDDGGGGFLVEDDDDDDGEGVTRSGMNIDTDAQKPSPTALSHHLPVTQADISSIEKKVKLSETRSRETETCSKADVNERKEQPLGDLNLTEELTQAEFEEACLLQQLHEVENVQSQPREEIAPQTSIEHSPGSIHAQERMLGTTSRQETPSSAPHSPPTSSTIQPASSTALNEAESPRSDKGSLLSEDPEDEDAEPDWLM